MIDICMFNDELDVLRYRFKLHSAFAQAFLVVESNLTWSGLPKKLVATDALTAEELTRYNVWIVTVPFPEALHSKKLSNWRREVFQRKFLNQHLLSNFPRHVAYFSDIDEFLDPASVPALRQSLVKVPSRPRVDCLTPRHRMYYYSEHCPVVQQWTVSGSPTLL